METPVELYKLNCDIEKLPAHFSKSCMYDFSPSSRIGRRAKVTCLGRTMTRGGACHVWPETP